LLSPEAKRELLQRVRYAERWIRRLVGSEELINGIEQMVPWLKASRRMSFAQCPRLRAVQSVRKKRLESKRETTRELAETPTLFGEIRQPSTDYLAYPEVSSERSVPFR